MDCSHCGGSFPEPATQCPQCGQPMEPPQAGVVKTASVRVAAGDADRIYRSLDEIPPELRKKIENAINSPNSETVVIADERGREKIFEVVSGLPPPLRERALAALGAAERKTLRLSDNARLAVAFCGLTLLVLLLWWIWG